MSPRNSSSDDPSLLRLVGSRLHDARRAAGLTQDAVAVALAVTNDSISRWENGRNAPAIDQVVRLAQLYGVSVDWVVGLASHPLGLKIGHAVVDETIVSAIRASDAAGLSLEAVRRFVMPPGVAYAWDIPERPLLLSPHAASSLHAEMKAALARLEDNTQEE